jgi:hypothetical protein
MCSRRRKGSGRRSGSRFQNEDSVVADKHAESIYEFEDRFPWANHNNATLAQCRDAIRSACTLYGIEPPAVIQHRRASMSWCESAKRRISLQAAGAGNRGGKNVATALHEAAHQITYDLCHDRAQDHGPTFAGVFFFLLERAGWPRSAIHAVAREHKVKWVERPPAWFRRRESQKAPALRRAAGRVR